MIIGLVGKPSSGKSTFFSASTFSEVPIASYPFTTIEANKGIGFVRIEDVGKDFGVESNPKTGFIKGKYRFVPVEIIDVAGLIPGAHEGKGLGNKFLDDLRQADVLIHVVDLSGKTNEKGERCEKHEPEKDIIFLEKEINYWFLAVIKKNFEKIRKIPFKGKNEFVEKLHSVISGLSIRKEDIEKALLKMGKEILKDEDIEKFAFTLREIAKPIVVAGNKIDEKEGFENFKKLKEKYDIVPCSALSELVLKKADKKGVINYVYGESNFEIIGKIDEKEKKGLDYIKKNVLEKIGNTGVQQALEKAVFDVLGYIAVFPGGVNKLADSEGRVLPDCFLMPKGSTALDFAYRLHTDFGKNFIKAIDVRSKKLIGKEYCLKNRDVIEIVHNAR